MKYIIALFLFVPFIFTIISFIIFAKLKVNKGKALGYAADLTTPLFMITIPIVVNTVWDIHITFYFICALLIIGIIVTFIEWRTKKEIEIPLCLRKIWRIYFLLLSVMYMLVMIIGLIYEIVQYFQ